MDRVAGDEGLIAPGDFVVEPDAHWCEQGSPRPDFEFVVVLRRSAVLAMRFDDGQLYAVSFHCAIAVARISQPVGPSNLEPDEIVCVIHHAHAVRLRISHANRGASDEPGVGVGHARCVVGVPAAAARSIRVARSGSAVPKIACPATRMFAPAATTRGAVSSSMPPSISIGTDEPASFSTART